MCTTFLEGDQVVVAVFGVQIKIVSALKLVHGERSISKMEPGFTKKDELRVIVLDQFVKIVFIPEQAFTVPG